MTAAAHKIKNLEKLLAHGQRHRFSAKTTLIAAGARDDTLSLILKGSATVMIEAEEGRELVIAYLNAGDFFGELGLFQSAHGAQAHDAWVRAKTECEVVQISYAAFRELAQQEPDMLYAVGGQMAQRLRDTTRKVGDQIRGGVTLVQRDVAGRLDPLLQTTLLIEQIDGGRHRFALVFHQHRSMYQYHRTRAAQPLAPALCSAHPFAAVEIDVEAAIAEGAFYFAQ